MAINNLLISNRGEIAIRVARSAADVAMRSHVIYAEDDRASDHTNKADQAHALKGSGPSAYLDGAQIIRIAREAGCDAIHLRPDSRSKMIVSHAPEAKS